jgi:hypothetical protein
VVAPCTGYCNYHKACSEYYCMMCEKLAATYM